MKEEVKDQNFNGHRIATSFHDTGSKRVVIFCHGYRGANIGPNRFFVKTARLLAENGISSLRFDQYGSGNSEGDFMNSSFIDWVKTTKAIVKHYLEQNFEVALFGQSMGGSTVIVVGAEMSQLSSIVAWAPDPCVEDFVAPESCVIEENGQIVRAGFWQEAHDSKIVEKLALVRAPAYIVQCSADEFVDERNRDAITKSAQPNHQVDIFEGYPHSKWTYEQSQEIIRESVDFLAHNF